MKSSVRCTVPDSFRPCMAGGWENEKKKIRGRERERQGRRGDQKIKEGNGVRYENIRWDVKTVNSRAFVLSPRSPPLSRTRKSTGLMVSFIISYTLAVLSVRVRPKSQPLPTLSPRFFSFQSFKRSFFIPLSPSLWCDLSEKCSSQLIRRSILCVSRLSPPQCIRIFLSND